MSPRQPAAPRDSECRSRLTVVTVCAAGVLLAASAGCGTTTILPGDTAADVQQRLGAPTAEHLLPDGVRRLEYSGTLQGKQTLMVDFDAQGRFLRAENVRDEVHFNSIRAGITVDELRAQIGRPSYVWGVRYRNQTVWSYRYRTPFCIVFHVGITPTGIVEDTSYGPDPMCQPRFGIHG
jgi:hypothetical protein